MSEIARVVIVGSGLAGISLALRLADHGVRSIILTKSELASGSSVWAQGGIAAVLDARDSFEAHINDTLEAGAGLCNLGAVRTVVEGAPSAISWLSEAGVHFDLREDKSTELHLAQEGGHSHRRVAHVADTTGRAVVQTLDKRVLDSPFIDVLENHLVIDLIKSDASDTLQERVVGLYALNLDSQEIITIPCDVVVLATGGASKAYLYTSNPDTSTGDGIAISWRAGCSVYNMEFVQFHPTCLFHPHAGSFLISEAVRGEGGRLILPDGALFMDQHDSRGELAPRDVVARAIDYEMKKGGLDCVYLDITHKSRAELLRHFPAIYERCQTFGFDMAEDPIPVVPAAHYTCGGITVDSNGATEIPGLFALGENACSGLHGANRLASNSLLECIVFSERAAIEMMDYVGKVPKQLSSLPSWDESQVTDPDELVVVAHNWDELRRSMWDYVGIVRTSRRLQRAANRLKVLSEEIRDFYSNFTVNQDLLELRNLVLVSELIVRSAAARKESRGLHYTLDYPHADPHHSHDTVLKPVRQCDR
ncbi:MAG: L-aspartate oxidase [Gammaproteobacteria bacterium]